MTKDKAREIADIGAGEALAQIMVTGAQSFVSAPRGDALERFRHGVRAIFWARKAIEDMIEVGELDGIA